MKNPMLDLIDVKTGIRKCRPSRLTTDRLSVRVYYYINFIVTLDSVVWQKKVLPRPIPEKIDH